MHHTRSAGRLDCDQADRVSDDVVEFAADALPLGPDRLGGKRGP